ncbi:MAG: RdgB/HAM1 family non-canonical purine NTP pyrophosphatase [Candidatus Rariloculaceae bacterium]
MTAVSSRWVLASGNRGKVAEIQALLGDSDIEIVPQAELGIVGAEETGTTFIENALLKARHASRMSGLPAIADDSGIAVDALGGAPGVHSARFAGVEASDQANVDKLLKALATTPDPERGACFHCLIVAMRAADDPAPIISHGLWRGRISRAPAGEGGFGYDPVFFVPGLDATAAQLAADAKNRISHRGQALAELLIALNKQRDDR